MDEIQFHIVDYVVMALFLVISSAIGIYFGFFRKQATTEEYLLGGRKMHLFPVALSLLVTYQSAISVLGVPTEVYMYNVMIFYMYLAICIANVLQATLLVPLFYPLRITSAYEYLGRRFQSRSVQLLGAILGMLQTLLYMSIVLLAPALALEAVAGVPLWMSVIIIGVVGTVYTSIGGMKTVIWTDVFQFIILYGGLTVILIMGGLRVGSLTRIFNVANDGKRLLLNESSGDPRVRHTVWGLLFGGVFQWLPNCCNQSAVQRICSMRCERDAKVSTFLNVPLMIIYGLILILTGLLLYAYFVVEGCCPITSGKISNANQLVPYFVMHVLNDVPGLAGIFVAALFSGALSSLSSGINAMSANTLQDLLVNVISRLPQRKKTLIAKCVVFVYGMAAVVMAYAARNLSGPVTQMALSAMGAAGGPVVGIFFLGATFPQSNWIGALSGGILSICINVWIAIGSILHGTPAPKSPPIFNFNCDLYGASEVNITGLSNYTLIDYTEYMSTETTMPFTTRSTISKDHLAVYNISYTHFGFIGFMITITSGLIVSFLTGGAKAEPTEDIYIFPCLRTFWRKQIKQTKAQTKYSLIIKEDGTELHEDSGLAKLTSFANVEIPVRFPKNINNAPM